MPLKNIPVGTNIHNIELKPGGGGQLIRSAGSSAQIVSKEEPYVQIKLISGEIRHINKNSKATIGEFQIQIIKILNWVKQVEKDI